MPGPTHEFTDVSKFIPETFGEPGMRTFRINVDSASSTANVWLEKEQLAELCLAMVQMEQETRNVSQESGEPPKGIEASGLTNLDFKADRLAFGHNPDSGFYIVDAHDPEDESGDEPTVRIWVTRKMIIEFSKSGLAIVSAGRPICQLCNRAMNPQGHYCERSNGHSKEAAEQL